MKAGIATNLFVFECVKKMDLELAGDLLFESVIDEEFGGSNGTLAGRLRGHNAAAAILSEPSSLRICPAQRGGRTVHIKFRSSSGGVLSSSQLSSGVVPQLTHFLASVNDFAAQRLARVQRHGMYAAHADPVPVSVTKVFTSPWGFNEPITIPDVAQVELYWQLMPGETQAEVEKEFDEWFRRVIDGAPDVFQEYPEVTKPIRWLPGSSIRATDPLVTELAASAERVLGKKPAIEGIEGPCDLFVFQQGFGIPAAVFGACGGNTHAANEYVEIDSVVAAAKTLMLFIAEWCGSRHA
jgi:acetylornithine deacetylase